MYLQGMSSSLPEEVQIEFYKTIDCLKDVKIMRNAYAIEYDCIDPSALKATLEMKNFEGLYGAGQFNGSSGYEEAAAQGLIAGINAALKIKDEGNDLPILAFLHFPPVFGDFICREIIDVLNKYDIKNCFYGHIHGNYYVPKTTEFEGINFIISASDYLNFSPMPIFPKI
jgi:hypothetical protein